MGERGREKERWCANMRHADAPLRELFTRETVLARGHELKERSCHRFPEIVERAALVQLRESEKDTNIYEAEA